VARFGQRWAGPAEKREAVPMVREERMANGSLTANAMLVLTMERLVSIRRLADEVLKKSETLVMIVVGNTSAQVQRAFLLQVLEAEAVGLTEMVRRLLPQPPTDAAPEA
jgi:hypothetical protein